MTFRYLYSFMADVVLGRWLKLLCGRNDLIFRLQVRSADVAMDMFT